MTTLRWKIKPILGTKNNVPQDDSSLINWISQDLAETHDVGGQNIDYTQNENACTKSKGYTALTSAACSGPVRCQGLFELDDGVNDDFLHFQNGYVHDMTDGTASTITCSITFAAASGDLYSIIQFGPWAVWADGTNTPYKWKNGATVADHLIDTDAGSGYTQYVFRYLCEWQRRIIGAYSTATNGDLEIRWTGALPDFTGDIEFPAANQLYKPTVDSITGISKLGSDAVLLYGEDSISQIVYYPSATTPFGIFTLVTGEGCASHHSIVNTHGFNWFFNRNHGFVKYGGGNTITDRHIISKDIKADIIGIDERYYDYIMGKYLPFTEQIVWAVPLAAGVKATHFLYYHIPTGKWTKEVKPSWCIDAWKTAAGSYKKLVHGNIDGHVYANTGDDLATAALNGYRIEPIFDFGNPTKFKKVTEMWFGIVSGGDYSIDVLHRSGDTVKECLAASFAALGSLNLNNPAKPAIFFDKNARYHQFKWGTNAKDEPFCVNWIEFVYSIGERF